MIWRPATEADAQNIARIEQKLFADTAWPEALVREELTGPYRSYTAVEEDGVLLAYGGVLVVGTDADIQTLAVVEAARRRGLGRKLLYHLLTEAVTRGAQQVFLEVRKDNTPAIKLYEHTGFEHLGTRPGYYQPDGVDAFVMRLDLAQLQEGAKQ